MTRSGPPSVIDYNTLKWKVKEKLSTNTQKFRGNKAQQKIPNVEHYVNFKIFTGFLEFFFFFFRNGHTWVLILWLPTIKWHHVKFDLMGSRINILENFFSVDQKQNLWLYPIITNISIEKFQHLHKSNTYSKYLSKQDK